MNLKSQFRYLYTKYIKNCRVTLSGEINILTRDLKESILLDEELYNDVLAAGKDAEFKIKYIRFETVKELHQISIKMFSFKALCDEENLFENLKFQLENLLNKVTRDELVIRVNLSGLKYNWCLSEKFMIIYSNNEILYRVSETHTAPFTSCAIGRICNLLLSEIRFPRKEIA